MCLVVQRELRWRWCHAAISDFANHVFGTLKVSEVGVLSVVRTSPWYFVFLTFKIFVFSCLHNILVALLAYNAIFIMIYLIVFQLPFLHSVVFINSVCGDYTTL